MRSGKKRKLCLVFKLEYLDRIISLVEMIFVPTYCCSTGEYFMRMRPPPIGKNSVVGQKMGEKSLKLAIFNRINKFGWQIIGAADVVPGIC